MLLWHAEPPLEHLEHNLCIKSNQNCWWLSRKRQGLPSGSCLGNDKCHGNPFYGLSTAWAEHKHTHPGCLAPRTAKTHTEFNAAFHEKDFSFHCLVWPPAAKRSMSCLLFNDSFPTHWVAEKSMLHHQFNINPVRVTVEPHCWKTSSCYNTNLHIRRCAVWVAKGKACLCVRNEGCDQPR